MNDISRPDPTVKSAKRVLEIFELFATRRAPATVMDVARELGYPQSSTSTLMECLRTMGYLSYDRFSRQFSPTLRIAFLGNWVQEDMYTDTNILRIMSALQDKTGNTVILGLQNDIHVQYIHTIQGESPLRLFIRPGTLRPLARASTGKMLLSAKPDSEIRALLIRINADEEAFERRVDLSELMDDIRFCREEGYFCSNGSVTEGAGVISMLLPPGNGHPPMALGIGGPLPQILAEKQGIIDLLRDVTGPKLSHKKST
jgi:DNA-binding IclR family transcriptional regulator